MSRVGWLAHAMLLVIAGCSAPQGATPTLSHYSFREIAMGCEVRVEIYAANEASAVTGARRAFDEINRIDLVLSDYSASSEVRSIEGASDQWHALSPDLASAMTESHLIWSATGGAFDVTTGALSHLWRDARKTGVPPTGAQLDLALANSGWRLLEFNVPTRELRLNNPHLRFDFGGIGKGFAAQRAMLAAQSHGERCILVAIAGDIACGDPPPGKPGWTIGIASGLESDTVGCVTLSNICISTSGDQFQHLAEGGRRHSHIFDPRSGSAITTRRGATVISSSGAQADALATALCVDGCGLLSRLQHDLAGLERFEARLVEESVDADRLSVCQTRDWPVRASP